MPHAPQKIPVRNAQIGKMIAAGFLFLLLVPCCVLPFALNNFHAGILSLVLLGIAVGALMLNWPWLHARVPYWRWLALAGLLGLAGVISVGRGYVSDLPTTRPDDFSVRLHSDSAFGQYIETFDVSATTCQLFHSSREHPRSTMSCNANPVELNAVYQVLRQQRFDQIRYHAIPLFACSEQDGEYYMQVTANGHIYRKENPGVMCVVPLTGVAQWDAVEHAILALKKQKIKRGP